VAVAGENQWGLDEFDLHSISPSQTHRDKVRNFPVTRVVERHPTYLLVSEPKGQAGLFSDEVDGSRHVRAVCPLDT
jgi:hypothetical protein